MKKIFCVLFVLVLLVGCSESQVVDESPILAEDELMDKGMDKVGVERDMENDKVSDKVRNGVVKDSAGIYINNVKLSREQIEELERVYGVAPKEGSYWYDSLSGSYGIMHGDSLGVLFPGHDFGELPADASNGNTGVFINGRELPEMDIQFLEWIFGIERQEGRYWQDALGNIGYEGDPTPVLNLYVAYHQRSGGSKDNYWAANFGSYGNEQNGFGYVMVDGASVTYGG